jgi:uracil-DNA glycosylase family 4
MRSADLDKRFFDPACRRCERLAGFLGELKQQYPTYHCHPVAPFGDDNPDLLIVGLAPGMHGANATGRPFTGDFAGILLYESLFHFGYSNRAESLSLDDGLVLSRCRITNAVKCLPPQNKPTGGEINLCNRYLAAELESMRPGTVIMALGSIAHTAVLKAQGLKLSHYRFGHGHQHSLVDNRWLVDSYHCSRYNTQTKRLTETMFHDIFRQVEKLLGRS